jgi:hypothetical protein
MSLDGFIAGPDDAMDWVFDYFSGNAENAEDDAVFAIRYAEAAIDEAEYAVLDAALTRAEADELAATTE